MMASPNTPSPSTTERLSPYRHTISSLAKVRRHDPSSMLGEPRAVNRTPPANPSWRPEPHSIRRSNEASSIRESSSQTNMAISRHAPGPVSNNRVPNPEIRHLETHEDQDDTPGGSLTNTYKLRPEESEDPRMQSKCKKSTTVDEQESRDQQSDSRGSPADIPLSLDIFAVAAESSKWEKSERPSLSPPPPYSFIEHSYSSGSSSGASHSGVSAPSPGPESGISMASSPENQTPQPGDQPSRRAVWGFDGEGDGRILHCRSGISRRYSRIGTPSMMFTMDKKRRGSHRQRRVKKPLCGRYKIINQKKSRSRKNRRKIIRHQEVDGAMVSHE